MRNREFVIEELSKTFTGSAFLLLHQRKPAETVKCIDETLEVLRDNGLTLDEALGFLDFMKYQIMEIAEFPGKD